MLLSRPFLLMATAILSFTLSRPLLADGADRGSDDRLVQGCQEHAQHQAGHDREDLAVRETGASRRLGARIGGGGIAHELLPGKVGWRRGGGGESLPVMMRVNARNVQGGACPCQAER